MSPAAFVSIRPSQAPVAAEGGGHGDPCSLVICGATGDLARRKLYPAIYDLARNKLLAQHFQVIGVDRVVQDDDAFRAMVRTSLENSEEVHGLSDSVWEWLAPRLRYVHGNLLEPEIYTEVLKVAEKFERGPDGSSPIEANRMFYLALPPSIFPRVVRSLSESGLAPRTDNAATHPWRRVVVEKPFGVSLATAQALSELLLSLYNEHQIYRIDHYLAKETVQNILVLRSANLIFEPLWNNRYISHVQITAAETVGVEGRGKYYEEAGVLRDMFQNHLLQLLSLTAMELPAGVTADAVRDEKVKALRSLVPIVGEKVDQQVIGAQYRSGTIKGRDVSSYRGEPDVHPDSVTPTYAAMKVMIHNWRWQGVPFYLRSGKRLARRHTEIALHFRQPPTLGLPGESNVESNTLVIRIQPNEGIHLQFQVKVPGAALALTPEIEVSQMDMDFSYAEAFGSSSHAAYSTLLLDCMIGDATLFARTDEVEAAWRFTDPILDHLRNHPPKHVATYESGSWGPHEADEMLLRDGFTWRKI